MRKTHYYFIGLIAVMFLTFNIGTSFAAEVLLKEVIEKKIRVEEVFEKTADNFIIMFDASGSMGEKYKDTGMSKFAIAKKILGERGPMVPDLGYKSGLYLYTPWKPYSEMQPYSSASMEAAIQQLPTVRTAGTYVGQPTPLGRGFVNLNPILSSLSGKTVVFVFSDGSYTFKPDRIYPTEAAKELAMKYDVCFNVISSAQTEKQLKTVADIAAVNECSRVVSFDRFIEDPNYFVGALFVVKTNKITDTIISEKLAGFSIKDIRFKFDKVDVRPEFYGELEALAKFLNEHPKTTALIQGFTDNAGRQEYNLNLSRRRAVNIGQYLTTVLNIPPNRYILEWYGPANPIASNDTEEGRQLNRRVEIDIYGM